MPRLRTRDTLAPIATVLLLAVAGLGALDGSEHAAVTGSAADLLELINRYGALGVLVVVIVFAALAFWQKWIVIGWLYTEQSTRIQALEREAQVARSLAPKNADNLHEVAQVLPIMVTALRDLAEIQRSESRTAPPPKEPMP